MKPFVYCVDYEHSLFSLGPQSEETERDWSQSMYCAHKFVVICDVTFESDRF